LTVVNTKKDDCGNLLGVDIEIEGKKITLINIYGPNNDTPLFYNKDSETIEYFKQCNFKSKVKNIHKLSLTSVLSAITTYVKKIASSFLVSTSFC
jgi:hypothetical protein